MPSVELDVPAEAAGERLDRFLSGIEEVGSRAAAERLLAAKRVRVNGSPRPKSHRLEAGDRLDVELPERRETSLEPEQLDLRIAYDDEHLLVVDKPAGIVVHPSAGHDRGTLVHGLLGHAVAGGEDAERPGIVHRLDRDTSGLLVIARSDEAHRRLQRQLRKRELVREYLALVRGRPRSRRGRIEAPLGRDRRDPTRVSIDTNAAREAATNFEVVEAFPRHALLKVTLDTGRTHQIRVHLAAIDLPVSGDRTYGIEGDLGLERQFLHAARLAFPHPFTGEGVEAESPLPGDLQAALEEARS
ncbi:MAG TPA: RluA family pseudouridine synthase [Gaiellaceae bacterium]|nr:RluA family pseudouridine synthase [Gaiellaceae bacterium]